MISEPLEEMKKIYTFIHEDFADQTENAMKAWQEENKHEMGSHKYSLEEYGLSKDEIEKKFKTYIDTYIGEI
jgi:Rps23 Pro-64 3,4-dihydroxylase Tpa1-like proline 4-hydroxylase